MSLPADYHTHTPLCRHAKGEPTELAAQAIRVGLQEMGFSDHNPMPEDDFDDWRMLAKELDGYVAKVEQARQDHPTLKIKLALEVDYVPGYEDWVRDLARRHHWDYLIGSVHYLSGRWAIDNPTQIARWKQHDPLEVWTSYCDHLTKAACSGLFDIIGHADLCKKFCFYPRGDPAALFKDFIRAAKDHRVAIELNTAGLRKDCREIYPSPTILQMAAQAQVPITFGSDAHAPEEVGLNLAEAVQLARGAGYTSWVRFTQRRAEEVKL
jgi:histidinol-phosphatase (PHP family)